MLVVAPSGVLKPEILFFWFPGAAMRFSQEDMRKYWRSAEWTKMKADLITIRGWRCERCGKKTTGLVPHHLSYERFKEEILEDLMLLCFRCHAEVHGKIHVDDSRSKKRRACKNNKPAHKRKTKKTKSIAPAVKVKPRKVKFKKDVFLSGHEQWTIEATIKRCGLPQCEVTKMLLSGFNEMKAISGKIMECNRKGLKFSYDEWLRDQNK